MLYHTPGFAAFFIATLAGFWIAPTRVRPLLLLAASYAFYADFRLAHLAILLGVTAATYYGALWIAGGPRGRTGVALPVAAVLCVLGLFKYYGFVWSVAGLAPPLGWEPELPIGISFYTFQAVSYLVDVHRGRVEAQRSPTRVALYLAFFPQVLAGPIERAGSLMAQLVHMRRPEWREVYVAAKVVLWGLFCKLVVADQLGAFVDPAFAAPDSYPAPAMVGAVYLYAFQIFFDFYGYTNVSIGLALALGVRLSINFNNPYSAGSIREFWRRWHITLTRWFRDYVYVPLGGNAVPKWRWAMNVGAVFLLSGLWHGAAMPFAVWGALHGTYYLVGAATRRPRAAVVRLMMLDRVPRLHHAVRVLTTFHLVVLAWVFFRADTVQDAGNVLARFASVLDVGATLSAATDMQPAVWVALASLAFAVLQQSSGWAWRAAHCTSHTPLSLAKEVLWVNVLVVSLVLLTGGTGRVFIYFQF